MNNLELAGDFHTRGCKGFSACSVVDAGPVHEGSARQSEENLAGTSCDTRVSCWMYRDALRGF